MRRVGIGGAGRRVGTFILFSCLMRTITAIIPIRSRTSPSKKYLLRVLDFSLAFISLHLFPPFFVCAASFPLFSNYYTNKDVRVLFLVIAALVMLAALAVYFKIINVYNTLVHSYTARSVCSFFLVFFFVVVEANGR